MAKLTDKKISGLKKKDVRYEIWDGNGLGVRITPKGIKSFVFVYHFEKKSRRLTLGRYRSSDDKKNGVAANGIDFLTLAQARKAVLEAQEKIERGIDPATEKQITLENERKAETISELADLYIEIYAKVHKRTWKEDERILNRDIKPKWGNRKANSITRVDVIKLLDEITARPAPIMANRVLSLLSKMFRWSIPRGYVTSNPTEFIEKPGKEIKRERALLVGEVKKFWDGIDVIDHPGVKNALKLLLVTAQRRGEIAGIEISELDESKGLLTLPGSRTKSGRPHAIPLSNLALEIIREARIESAKIEDCELSEIKYLFPAFTRLGKLRSLRPDKLTELMMLEMPKIIGRPLSPHDLRRSASTIMGSEELSIPRFVRDRILNHADRSPGSHYDLNEYLAEKRTALNAWGDFISEAIQRPSGKVVAIGARG